MKKITTGLLAFSLLLFTLANASAATKPGSSGGGGGRSYSSSGGASKSYSSGSKSYSSSGSKPSASSGSKSYSSGKPSASSSGGKSYSSSGGGSKPSTTTAPPKPASSSVSGSGGKSYTSGNKTYTAVSPASGSSKPKGGVFDGGASAAQKRAESKAAYVKGPEPKSTYTTPTGKETKIDPGSKSVEKIRTMDHDKYVTREVRIHTFYQPYYSRPIVVYNDPYNSFFWYWMLDRSLEERAMWAYCHHSEIDSARYQALLAKDARLEARVRQLEANKTARDPSYVPSGIDPDLQYTDDYVDSIYNPHVESAAAPTHIGRVLFWVFMVVLIGGVVAFVVYMVFVKNY